MRYSYLWIGFLLYGLQLSGQTVIDIGSDSGVDITGGQECITLVDLQLPSSFATDFFEISQTGEPFGTQSGYSHIINRSEGCIPQGNVIIDFVKTGECDPFHQAFTSGYYTAEVYFNNKLLASEVLEGIGSHTFSIPVSDLRLEHVAPVNSIVPLELRINWVVTALGGTNSSHIYNQALAYIMVVENGSNLYFQHEQADGYLVTSLCNRVALQELDDRLQNCSPTEEITLLTELKNFSSDATTTTFTAGYSITASIGAAGAGSETAFNYNSSLQASAGHTVQFEDEQILSNSSTMSIPIVLPPRTTTGCSFMGLDFIGKTVYVQSYEVGCEGLVPGTPTNEREVYTAVQPRVCTETGGISEDCFPAVIDFNIRREHEDDENMIANSVGGISTGGCIVNISAIQEPEPDYAQTIVWEGPDGYTAVGTEIEGAPLGVYIVTVSDECGDEAEYLVDACEGGAVVSSWEFDEELNQFCRSITCDGGEECEGVITLECVAPEFGPWEYDAITGSACRSVQCPDGSGCDLDQQCVTVEYGPWDFYENGTHFTCVREVLAQGESIARDEHPSLVTYDYDPITEQCYEYVRCAAPDDILPVLVQIEQEAPVFTDWSFEEFTEICVRQVRCFERTAEQVMSDPNLDFEQAGTTKWENQNDNPDYLWEYQEGWGCIGYVFCDPFEASNHPINADWELNNGEGNPIFTSIDYYELFGVVSCVLDVDCEFNGHPYDTPEAFPPLTSEPIDPVSAHFIGTPDVAGYCEFEYQCGTAPPYTVDRPFVGEFIGTDANGNDLCVAYCEGFKATTSQPPVLCRDINGFVDGTNTLLKTPSQPNYQLKWQSMEWELLSAAEANPNPFKDEIVLHNLPTEMHGLRAVLINVDGRVILEQGFQNATSAKLSTVNLPSGVYLLMLLGGNDELIYEKRLLKVD